MKRLSLSLFFFAAISGCFAACSSSDDSSSSSGGSAGIAGSGGSSKAGEAGAPSAGGISSSSAGAENAGGEAGAMTSGAAGEAGASGNASGGAAGDEGGDSAGSTSSSGSGGSSSAGSSGSGGDTSAGSGGSAGSATGGASGSAAGGSSGSGGNSGSGGSAGSSGSASGGAAGGGSAACGPTARTAFANGIAAYFLANVETAGCLTEQTFESGGSSITQCSGSGCAGDPGCAANFTWHDASYDSASGRLTVQADISGSLATSGSVSCTLLDQSGNSPISLSISVINHDTSLGAQVNSVSANGGDIAYSGCDDLTDEADVAFADLQVLIAQAEQVAVSAVETYEVDCTP